MEYSDTMPNYRYDFLSALGGTLNKRGGAMTKWSLVVCSLAVLLVLSVGLMSGSVPAEEKTLTAEGKLLSPEVIGCKQNTRHLAPQFYIIIV